MCLYVAPLFAKCSLHKVSKVKVLETRIDVVVGKDNLIYFHLYFFFFFFLLSSFFWARLYNHQEKKTLVPKAPGSVFVFHLLPSNYSLSYLCQNLI